MSASLSRGRLLKGALASLAAASVLRGGARAATPTPTAERPAMLSRPIPSTGEAMPVIGLGTYQVFDVGRNQTAKPALRQVLNLLFESGGRMIDSSPMYGTAEAVTGELLADLNARPKAFLATKVWTQGKENGIAQMKQSAERLRTKVIDLMQIHNLVDWKIHLATLRRMKEDGSIRYLGITHYTTGALAELATIIAREPLDFVQLGYSIETREAEARLLPLCIDRQVAVIVNQPFEQGALFRKLRGRSLPAWAAEFDCTSWAQLFLKYLIGHPAITCVIPATDKPDHMADDLAAGFGRQPDAQQRQQMTKFWDSL
jgi:diketogulonate reductase-like aldo/keto reductase